MILPLIVDFVALAFLDTNEYRATGTTTSMSAQCCIIPPERNLPDRNKFHSDVTISQDSSVVNNSDSASPYDQKPTPTKSQAIHQFYTCMLVLHDDIKQSVVQLHETEYILSNFNTLKISTLRHYATWQEYNICLVSAHDL